MEKPLDELRRYREYRHRRDWNIRRAVAEGHSRELVAAAVGMSPATIKEILNQDRKSR